MFRKFNWADKDRVKAVVAGKISQSAILMAAGLKPGSNNYKTLRKWAKTHEIDLPIFVFDGRVPLGRKFQQVLSDDDLFAVNSPMRVSGVKYRIKRDKLIDYVCTSCGNTGVWQGQPLSLHLDHKNGKREDNRLSNLQYLCPNCHSQTETYANKKRKVKKNQKGEIRLEYRRFNPEAEELKRLVWEIPTQKVALMFGVSDKAIDKRCRLLGIEKPPRGYWAKMNAIKK